MSVLARIGDREARLALGVLSAVLVLGTLVLDLPRASRGEVWGDGAT